MGPRARLLPVCLIAAVAAALAACEAWPPREPAPVAEPVPVAPLPTTPPPAPNASPEPSTHAAPVVERGTGLFVRPQPGRSRASITRNAAGEVTLNVVDADLREVV